MKISTEINSIAKRIGEKKAIELVAKAGFDAWDFSMFAMAKYDKTTGGVFDSDHPLHTNNYAAFAKELKYVADEYGIVCNQSHAPFPSIGKEMRYYLKRAIECTAIVGGKICVIHPENTKSAEENAEMYFELLPFAKDHGVKIATENMWGWDKENDVASSAACSHHDDFVKHLRAVNDPSFVACLDIGHAAMRGLNTSVREMILALGADLQALHIHDNDLHRDNHQIPFSMKIDFNDMLLALAEIDYKGYFTLEADTYLSKFSDDELYLGVKDLCASARRLADNYKK